MHICSTYCLKFRLKNSGKIRGFLFCLESGNPGYSYSLRDAIRYAYVVTITVLLLMRHFVQSIMFRNVLAEVPVNVQHGRRVWRETARHLVTFSMHFTFSVHSNFTSRFHCFGHRFVCCMTLSPCEFLFDAQRKARLLPKIIYVLAISLTPEKNIFFGDYKCRLIYRIILLVDCWQFLWTLYGQ